jgi:tetratricopeptide (TPR) repeat protein
MADVFVSYARADAPVAARIAEGLKAAGYEVWWDTELLPHHAFAQSIEQEISAAAAVVVVWSENAVASHWVRAEADLARGQGKLVQVCIDRCALPLPFNQYQMADLGTWRGDASEPRWVKILASIAQLTHRPTFPPGAATKAPSRSRTPRCRKLLALAAVAAAGLVLGGLWLARSSLQAPARGARIAVQPYEAIGETPGMQAFAADLSERLQDTLDQNRMPTLSHSDAKTLSGPDMQAKLKALDVGLLFGGSVQAAPGAITVRTHLEDPVHHATLWSADLTGPSDQPDALQARVGARTVALLNCATQALRPRSGLAAADALAAYLHACDLATTGDDGYDDEQTAFSMLDAMRDVVRLAPNFAPAHSLLAIHAAIVHDLPGQSLIQEADREAHRALQLDPKDSDAYVTLGLLAPTLDFAQREHWFRVAIAADPTWPDGSGYLGFVMADLGRLNEAADYWVRAASISPLSLAWTKIVPSGMILTGQFTQADTEIARLRLMWPEERVLWRYQLSSLIHQKRWPDALKELDDAHRTPNDSASDHYVTRIRADIEALMSHSASAMATRRQAYLAMSADNPVTAMRYLSLLGFVNDAFNVADHYNPVGPGGAGSPAFLFDPYAAAMRRDPRFMALANKFGLPQYWRNSGKWPDFCAEPRLPYNCQAEAAKMKAVPDLFPKAR